MAFLPSPLLCLVNVRLQFLSEQKLQWKHSHTLQQAT